MKSIAFLIATLVIAATASTPAAARNQRSTLPTVFISAPEGGDLERVLMANGLIVRRFDTPTAAIEAAPANSAALVLARGYPAETTDLPDSLFAAAESKDLRLYVEYPRTLPDQAVGPILRARWERAVVATDFFGSQLP